MVAWPVQLAYENRILNHSICHERISHLRHFSQPYLTISVPQKAAIVQNKLEATLGIWKLDKR